MIYKIKKPSNTLNVISSTIIKIDCFNSIFSYIRNLPTILTHL